MLLYLVNVALNLGTSSQALVNVNEDHGFADVTWIDGVVGVPGSLFCSAVDVSVIEGSAE